MTLRYIHSWLTLTLTFRCSLKYTTRSFFSAVNNVFLVNCLTWHLKSWGLVILTELVKSKCIPILLYGLECFQLSNTDLQLLDFTFNRLFMKLFRTNSIDVVTKTVSITAGKVSAFSSNSCEYLSVRETNDATCRGIRKKQYTELRLRNA